MAIAFLTKLQQNGTVHPACINNDDLLALLADTSLSEEVASTISNLHKSKLLIISLIESFNGHIKSVLLKSIHTNYVYSGTVWETQELFDLMISNMQENNLESLTSYNLLRKNFYEWASIEYTNGKLFSIENMDMMTFENIDQLNSTAPDCPSTPFDIN